MPKKIKFDTSNNSIEGNHKNFKKTIGLFFTTLIIGIAIAVRRSSFSLSFEDNIFRITFFSVVITIFVISYFILFYLNKKFIKNDYTKEIILDAENKFLQIENEKLELEDIKEYKLISDDDKYLFIVTQKNKIYRIRNDKIEDVNEKLNNFFEK